MDLQKVIATRVAGMLLTIWMPNVGWSQVSKVIGSKVSCHSCKLALVRVTTVGDATGPGTVHQQGLVARDAKGNVYVSSNGDPGIIRRFDSAGRFLNTLGRRGQGPGEYVGRVQISFLENGRMLAVDALGRRATVMDSAGKVISTRSLPVMAAQAVPMGDGRIVATGLERSAELIGIPLHLIDSNGILVRSFGTNNERVELGRAFSAHRVLGDTDKPGTVWSARLNEYSMERWDTLGQKDVTLRRRADWFPPWNGPKGYIGVTRQPPAVIALFERHDSLWMFLQVDDANWKPNPPIPFPGMKDATYTPDSFRENLFDTMVEVIHVPSGRLLVSQRLPQNLIGVSRTGYAFSYEEDARANPKYVVWRLVLRGG